MSKTIAKILVTMLALLITAAIIPGMNIDGIGAGFIAALILGLVNILIRPLLTILTIPITVLTLGLFLFVINGLMLLLTASLVGGFYISGLLVAILGSIVLSLISGLLNNLIG